MSWFFAWDFVVTYSVGRISPNHRKKNRVIFSLRPALSLAHICALFDLSLRSPLNSQDKYRRAQTNDSSEWMIWPFVHPPDGSNSTFWLDDLSLLQLKDGFANFRSYPSFYWNWPLKILSRAYNSYKWPKFEKFFWILRLVYQIDRFFALIEDLQSKVPRNAYFGHQRAAHFGHQRAKTSNSHFSTNLGPRGLKFFLGHSMSPIKNHACNNWNLWNFAS